PLEPGHRPEARRGDRDPSTSPCPLGCKRAIADTTSDGQGLRTSLSRSHQAAARVRWMRVCGQHLTVVRFGVASPGVSVGTLQTARVGVSLEALRNNRVRRQDCEAEIRACEIRAGEVRAGEIRAEDRASEVRALEVRAIEFRAGEVRLSEVRAGEVRLTEFRAGEVRLSEVRARGVGAWGVRSGEVRPDDLLFSAGEVR